MNQDFKALLLETLREVQKHEDGEKGVASRQYAALLESFKLVREHMEIQAAIILNDTFNNNKKDNMNPQFKELLLETLRQVKDHPDGEKGVCGI